MCSRSGDFFKFRERTHNNAKTVRDKDIRVVAIEDLSYVAGLSNGTNVNKRTNVQETHLG